MNPPSLPEEIFCRLLDESPALLAAPEGAGIAIPDDELHREIIVPLLPALLADPAIRQHWSEQAATSFIARLARHLEGTEPAPRWLPGDFQIHVTASYSAGPDARALADTLLSEDSLRDLTAALMNQLLDAVWPSLAPAPVAVPEAEPAPATPTETETEILPSAIEPVRAAEILTEELQATHHAPSRALIRALCRQLAASVVQRGLAANCSNDTSAAIIARRIFQRTMPSRKKRRTESRAARLG